MADELRDGDAPRPLGGGSLSRLDVDIRLAVIEYADVAAEYAPAVANLHLPRSVLRDYEIVVDVLALARRVPSQEVPALLAIGTRALRRVHEALPGGDAAAA